MAIFLACCVGRAAKSPACALHHRWSRMHRHTTGRRHARLSGMLCPHIVAVKRSGYSAEAADDRRSKFPTSSGGLLVRIAGPQSPKSNDLTFEVDLV